MRKKLENSEKEIIESENINSKTLNECILDNFKELHPLSSLCRISIISPLILHSLFFVFNLLTLFGFNTLIYYEDLSKKEYMIKKETISIIL